jgi:hypothetical protein
LANGDGAVTMQKSSIYLKFVNISVGENTKVYNICVSDQLTIFSATGNNIISMDYEQMSLCPKVVNIIYKGPLNHTEVTSLASIPQWI